MPNLIPGFIYQPIPINYRTRPRRRKGRGLVGHVAVSESRNLAPWNENDWHAYLPKVGPGIQYIDLDYVAYTSKDGSASLASFESQGGMGSTAQVNDEPWNDNQLRLAATFLRHLHDTEGVPLQVMPDSRPTSRGFGTHRLGVDPWRVSGGESWSSFYGKLCPGDRKHEQRFDVVRLAGAPTQEDFMATMSDQEKADLMEVVRVFLPGKAGRTPGGGWLRIFNTDLRVAALLARDGVDTAEFIAAIRPLMIEAVQAGMAADNADQADEIVDRLAARLGSAT